ncbi:MAG: site-2 protease family protein [Acidianus sp.]|nr:site-2 protease family protein [Acidianus sp.]
MNISLYIFAIGFVIFWGLILAFRKKLEPKGFTVYPLFLMWKKSTRSLWFPRLASSKPFKIYEKIAMILGILAMIGGITMIYYVIFGLIFHPQSTTVRLEPRLEPIIPGVTISLSCLPYILLALGISVTLHELSHAVSATSNKINVKSGGFILLGIFPGAFVEPADEEFMTSSLPAKIKILAAGIAVNLILAGIFFPLAMFLPGYFSQGLVIEGVIPHSSAYNASIQAGDIILSVNGIRTNTINSLTTALHQSTNYTIVLKAPNGSTIVKHAESTKHFLGVYVTYYFPPSVRPVLLPFLLFVTWMFIINFSLALFNAAPLIITDGGKIFTELLKKISSQNGEKMSMAIQAFLLMSLVYAIMLSISA